MARRMANAGFRSRQERDRYASHVRPINELADALGDHAGRGLVPHVAPWHGGAEARVLSVLQDPGRRDPASSGLLCLEEDDDVAARQALAFADAYIGACDVTPWNAYPWHIDRAPRVAELEAGVEPLRRVMALMPRLMVVLLQGSAAKEVWRRLLHRHPEAAAEELTVVTTYHPGAPALRVRDPAVRAARLRERDEAFARVAEVLRAPAGTVPAA